MSASILLKNIVKVRNWLYDKNIFSSVAIDVPVVSVGNISVGGTGKTPIISTLAQHYRDLGISVGIVSRGYKGSYQGVRVVNHQHKQAAHIYGDEPVMLSKSLDVPVVVSRKRVDGVRKLKEMGCQLVLADDAFQHRKLKREVDIVLIDATEDIDNYYMVPRGRLREPLSSLTRSDIIIVTKYNLIKDEQQQWDLWFDTVLKSHQLQVQNIIYANYKITHFTNLLGQRVEVPSQKAVLLSALARPLVFEQMIKAHGIEVLNHIKYRDHHEYSVEELQSALAEAKLLNSSLIVTAKDAVKINQLQFIKDKQLRVEPENVNQEKVDFSKDQTEHASVNVLIAELGVEFDMDINKQSLKAMYGQISSYMR